MSECHSHFANTLGLGRSAPNLGLIDLLYPERKGSLLVWARIPFLSTLQNIFVIGFVSILRDTNGQSISRQSLQYTVYTAHIVLSSLIISQTKGKMMRGL